VRCQVDTDKLDGLLRVLSAAGVRSLVSQPPTLEELFLRHYADAAPDAGPDAAPDAGPEAAPDAAPEEERAGLASAGSPEEGTVGAKRNGASA